ncbi:transposon Tf2-1 polyprotein isoform X1 [Raphanus sativus]|uniref:Transposon Tf2-1 polyprotein isoform X1 n=1 Tax=Raphanus sativus TaxID=3726 RepID=A0A9W3CE12_RAPSA|nr:transposon Tf2-1 polyprotein isoform X1 [Raphanus sativus]
MAFTDEVDDRINSIDNTVAELQNQVEVISGGWKRLTNSNDEMNNRIGSVEKELSAVIQILNRLESHMIGDKGKAVATSSTPVTQVPFTFPRNEPGSDELGYRTNQNSFANRDSLLKKIELPVFDGSLPYGWISRVERYFRAARYDDQQKVEMVALSLTGAVGNWYTWENEEEPFLSWNQFKQRMLDRFAESKDDEPRNRLSALKQTDSVQTYVREFEELINVVKGIDEDNLVSRFYTGLKPEMKEVIRMKEPKGLRNHIAAVVKMESSMFCRLLAGKSQPEQSSTKNNSSWSRAKPSGGDQHLDKLKTAATEKLTAATVARPRLDLTPEELAELKRLKLCFKCKAKWFKGHLCGNPILQVFTLINGSEVELGECTQDEEEAIQDTTGSQLMQISLFSFLGMDSPTTMKVRGRVGNHTMTILIDSGATHNFIAPTFIKKAHLPTITNTKLQVLLGTGIIVQGLGVCTQVPLHIQGLEFVVDCIALELSGVDLVLGVQWLRKLGLCEIDWEKQEWSFVWGKERVKLRGESDLHLPTNALQSLFPVCYDAMQDVAGRWLYTHNVSATSCEITPIEISCVLEGFSKVFDMPGGLPPRRDIEHQILLKPGTSPVSVRPYRYPQAHQEAMTTLVQDMLQKGIIRASRSPYSSPVLLVKKKDKSWRFCVDYRALNQVTVADKFPIPLIDQLLDQLHGAMIFSKLDLTSGYHQIRMQQEDVEKTAFRTHDGHYEFLVMPFGLTNAPASFQALMNEIFRPYLNKFILVFFDDILVYSSSLEEHAKHLQLALSILEQHQLYANKKKCVFGQKSVEYLGHVISEKGVATDSAKTEAMRLWPTPKNVKQLRGFLGLTGYYRRFIQSYGSLARPLTDLLKKEQFLWSSATQEVFDKLKAKMLEAPVLALPDFTQPFVVETDASGFGIGAVLMQNKRPIAYFSHGLSAREQQKPIYERELMAVVLAIRKWKHYLLGRRFVVHTDQRSLKYLLEQREVSMEYQKWLVKLLGYEFDILFKPGSENAAADGLSRIDHSGELISSSALFALTTPSALQLKELYQEIADDIAIQDTIRLIKEGNTVKAGLTVGDDKLWYKGRLVIPKTSTMIPLILAECHDGIAGGHSGVLKTVKRIQLWFHWEGLFRAVQQHVAACQICQTHKYSTLSPAGLLQPLPIPDQIWEDLSMDFIEGLPMSYGNNVILVVVDRLSKYSHFMLLKHPFTAAEVAKRFVAEIVRLHGFPKSIVSDRDKVFLSQFWKELFRLAETKLKFSTSFHPQTDGQTEVLNRCLETYLRCFASSHPRTWSKFLSWAELWYNTSYHTSLHTTPFRVVYGRDPPGLLRYEQGSTENGDLESMLLERDAMLEDVKHQLIHAQQLMKNNADKHRRDVEFEVGTMVFLKLRPYRQQSVARRVCQKLSAKYFGPYKVEERIGKAAYRLQLPTSSKIHPVFHVSQLKAVVGKHHVVLPLPELNIDDEELVLSPEEILDSRYNDVGQLQVLVKWHGIPAEAATWMDVREFRKQFPSYQLEGKLSVKGGGNDKLDRVFVRRGAEERSVEER